MNGKYWCASCKSIFEAEGTKKEWKDPIYGPCSKYVADCPTCKESCNEYREPSQKKTSAMPEMSCNGQCQGCQFAH